GFLMASYGLAYEPYWQDELASLEVARGILQNGIPHLAPGFIYPKAELYHYELALVIAVFGQNPVATRSLAVIAFLAVLPLTYYVGSQLFDRRVGLMGMGLLLFSPFELWWAQQTRMYQQAQVFVLLVFYFFYRATQPGARRRYIYLSMASVVLMYFSHEEGFIILPGIFLYFLLSQRLAWLRNRDWWIAGGGAIAIIGCQLIIVKLTSQPILGQDASQRPNIGFSPQNVDYYLRMLFNTTSLSSPTFGRYQLTYVSLIAFAACGAAVLSRHRAFRYTAFFFMASFLTLTLLLTLKADRYFYPLYPELTLLAAVGVIWGLDRVLAVARRRISPLTARVFIGVCAACLIIAVFASQIPAVATANLAISRTLGVTYGRQIPDFQLAGEYVQAHWQPGDALVVMGPADTTQFYAQEDPYTLYLGSALYIHQQGSHILDNYSDNLVLINEHDLVSVMATYHRVWLIRTTGYYNLQAQHFQVATSFYEVWETDGITVYLNTP
ncbi:MAG TPA: glycosyltransferase family 39 protein, partial [Ktedonobacterales bacterium]|nr:glycosyltransferase family 39 protein [Ktedonobacterales bacterium]